MAKKTGTAVANWDEQFAKDAEIAAAQEASTGVGKFFSLKSGVLSFGGSPMPDNQMAVVILEGIMENTYFDSAYDPENVDAPACYAFGRNEQTMEPHEKAGDKQSDRCATCPQNEFGSAETGRGKACANKRRLAIIPAGSLNSAGKFTEYTKAEQFKTTPIGYLRVPTLSTAGYAAFVKQLNNALKKPPHAMYTKIKVVPDPKSQFRVTFEPLKEIPKDLISPIMERRQQALTDIEAPYPPKQENQEPKGKGKKTGNRPKGRKY